MNRTWNWMLAAGLILPAIAIVVVLPRYILTAMRVPLTRGPAEIGISRFEEVSFSPPDQAITLRGWWFPADAARAAAVVVHGGGGNRSDPWGLIPELCRDLQSRGVAALAIDLRNHGSSDDAADGVVGFGAIESNDVIGAVDWIAHRQPGLPVAAIGFSMGGNAVIYAAARDRRIRAVVTTGTYADAASVLPTAFAVGGGVPWALGWLAARSMEHFHGVPISSVRAVDVVDEIEAGRLLIIHNEADPVVPIGNAWFLAAAGEDADLWIAPVPPEGDPFYAAAGPWGTHIKEYRLNPGEYLDRVVQHIDVQSRR